MAFSLPTWDDTQEPSQANIRAWLDNLYSRFMPLEQARWNQSNIDTLFYAGSQNFVNRFYGYTVSNQYQNFYFNLLQVPVQMVTGYQRQNRKAISYIPTEGADEETTDDYTKLITHVCNAEGIHETFSKACELAAVSGFVLLQPYLDYDGDDPAQGSMKLKIWEFNSFLCDPFFRDTATMSDASWVWCQQYVTKKEALERFPDAADKIHYMSAAPQRYGTFYFLPEQYNMSRNDLMVLSYVWYKSKRKRKRLYSRSMNQFFDFSGDDQHLLTILENAPDFEEVTQEVVTWKLTAVLNDQVVYQGLNPLGTDDCPFIPVVWCLDNHISQYENRCRSLVRSMRDANYLMNRKINISNDIVESTVNSGWLRKQGAVANEDNLRKTGQGYDIIVNEGYELTDIVKIQPSAVPASDFQLADQLQNLIFQTSGVNLESWSADNSPNASTLTVLMKQAGNLMVLQKFFDQWDQSLKILGKKMLDIVLHNWNAAKVQLLIGKEPSPYFFSRIFAKYNVVVEMGLLTPTQRYQEYMQWMELNQQLGGIIPPDKLAEKAPIQGKKELLEILRQQQQSQQAAQEQQSQLQAAQEEAKLRETYSKVANNMASAKERYGRFEADISLLEERISAISKNRSLATKAKTEALEKLLDVIQRYGEIETLLKSQQLDSFDYQYQQQEAQEKNYINADLARAFSQNMMQNF